MLTIALLCITFASTLRKEPERLAQHHRKRKPTKAAPCRCPAPRPRARPRPGIPDATEPTATKVEEFQEQQPGLFWIAYRMLGSASKAEDIMQDRFGRRQVLRASCGVGGTGERRWCRWRSGTNS
jgi:hypothetical protein